MNLEVRILKFYLLCYSIIYNPYSRFCSVVRMKWETTRTFKVWALPVSLATTPGIVIYSLFLCLLRCFSSAGSLSLQLWIHCTMLTAWPAAGFPIRIFPDQSLLAAPRDFSQSSTSFFGNICQGIRFVPLSTFLCIDWIGNWIFNHRESRPVVIPNVAKKS